VSACCWLLAAAAECIMRQWRLAAVSQRCCTFSAAHVLSHTLARRLYGENMNFRRVRPRARICIGARIFSRSLVRRLLGVSYGVTDIFKCYIVNFCAFWPSMKYLSWRIKMKIYAVLEKMLTKFSKSENHRHHSLF
jgi:hypothetical protein